MGNNKYINKYNRHLLVQNAPESISPAGQPSFLAPISNKPEVIYRPSPNNIMINPPVSSSEKGLGKKCICHVFQYDFEHFYESKKIDSLVRYRTPT
jgi:hypothetical protein